MNGIDRIQGGGGPEGLNGPDPSKEPEQVAADFESRLQEGGQEVTDASSSAPVEGGAFETMQARIVEGVEANQTRDEILKNVVQDELQRSFGNRARPEMAEFVADSLRGDDQLSILFDRLYDAALAGRRGQGGNEL